MTHPKFILTAKGEIKMGMVTLHKDLLESGDQCIGGGYWEVDYGSNRLLLDGESTDFGAPLWHLVDEVKVPKGLSGMAVVYYPSDGSEAIHVA